MGLMLLSVYSKPLLGVAAVAIQIIAVAPHLVLIVYFTNRFVYKLELGKVHIKYFIVYVGIAVASVTSSAYKAEALGKAIFWFAFACFIALLFLVAYRYVKLRAIPEPAQSLLRIFSAPASHRLTHKHVIGQDTGKDDFIKYSAFRGGALFKVPVLRSSYTLWSISTVDSIVSRESNLMTIPAKFIIINLAILLTQRSFRRSKAYG